MTARANAVLALVMFLLVIAAALWFPALEALVDGEPDYYEVRP